MRVLLAFLLIVAALGVIAYDHYDLEYWRTPPAVRAQQKWESEVKNIISKSKKTALQLDIIKDIQMTTTDQQFKDMIDATKIPFHRSLKGVYTLKIQVMPWIEEMKYGYLIQHEVFEANGNKINEFNINVDIGRLW